MFTVRSNFIGTFKIGDNINHNLRILELLYRNYEHCSNEEKILLRKPIILTLVSIIEAMLCDLHLRARHHTLEGIINMKREVLERIRGKKREEFEKYIKSAQVNNIFDTKDKLYEDLDVLRRLRNRVHIQNLKMHFEPDESVAFSEQRKVLAERVLEYISKFLSAKHPRPESVVGYVADFQFPWVPHFK